MSSDKSRLFWYRSTAGHWRLRVADLALAGLYRGYNVPAAIETELATLPRERPNEPEGAESSNDPAGDLIRLERLFRREAAQLGDLARTLNTTAGTTPAPTTAPGRLTGADVRPLPRAGFAEVAAALGAARERIRVVRAFVIAVDVSDGLLAQARVGWLRNPAAPVFASIYASETLFVIADPRRAVTGSGGAMIGGERFGVGWRRDGDDDDPDTDLHAGASADRGPWQLGYIPGTGEVYATRRCRYLDEQVWLLGRGFTDVETTRGLLTDLTRHMREPNSLLYAAHVLHTVDRDPAPDRVVAGHAQG